MAWQARGGSPTELAAAAIFIACHSGDGVATAGIHVPRLGLLILFSVIPAKAGIQGCMGGESLLRTSLLWIPACAGMTINLQ